MGKVFPILEYIFLATPEGLHKTTRVYYDGEFKAVGNKRGVRRYRTSPTKWVTMYIGERWVRIVE